MWKGTGHINGNRSYFVLFLYKTAIWGTFLFNWPIVSTQRRFIQIPPISKRIAWGHKEKVPQNTLPDHDILSENEWKMVTQAPIFDAYSASMIATQFESLNTNTAKQFQRCPHRLLLNRRFPLPINHKLESWKTIPSCPHCLLCPPARKDKQRKQHFH